LADWVDAGVEEAFREAHHIAGSIVQDRRRKRCDLGTRLALADMQKIEPAITAEVFKCCRPNQRAFAHEPGRHRAGAGEEHCLLKGVLR
jgi:argininosuccinate lyase